MTLMRCPCGSPAYATHDAPRVTEELPGERTGFALVRVAELVYGRRLRAIAREVQRLLLGHDPLSEPEMRTYQRVLEDYARLLVPWARNEARRMLLDVERRDRSAWRRHTQAMGRALRTEVMEAPTGHVMRALQDEQVALITSLPLEAARRVHRLTQEGLARGMRAAELSREVMRTGEVTRSRADLIARTEVGRASTSLVQARSQAVGSEGYIWRTANDRAVRPSHARMRGAFVRWDAPPTLDGLIGHAGALPNCRCRCSPVLPD